MHSQNCEKVTVRLFRCSDTNRSAEVYRRRGKSVTCYRWEWLSVHFTAGVRYDRPGYVVDGRQTLRPTTPPPLWPCALC